MTNGFVIATILLSTNVVESLHPSGNSKQRVETTVATVEVPGWTTNKVYLATNVTTFVWQETKKPERRPLERRDQPPLPPGITNNVKGK